MHECRYQYIKHKPYFFIQKKNRKRILTKDEILLKKYVFPGYKIALCILLKLCSHVTI